MIERIALTALIFIGVFCIVFALVLAILLVLAP